MIRLGSAIVLLVLAGVACGGARQSTTGVVIEVEGNITEVDGFVLRLADGSDLHLEPAAGLLFHENAPIGHLRDHLRSGEPIGVEFEILDDGTAVAYSVTD